MYELLLPVIYRGVREKSGSVSSEGFDTHVVSFATVLVDVLVLQPSWVLKLVATDLIYLLQTARFYEHGREAETSIGDPRLAEMSPALLGVVTVLLPALTGALGPLADQPGHEHHAIARELLGAIAEGLTGPSINALVTAADPDVQHALVRVIMPCVLEASRAVGQLNRVAGPFFNLPHASNRLPEISLLTPDANHALSSIDTKKQTGLYSTACVSILRMLDLRSKHMALSMLMMDNCRYASALTHPDELWVEVRELMSHADSALRKKATAVVQHALGDRATTSPWVNYFSLLSYTDELNVHLVEESWEPNLDRVRPRVDAGKAGARQGSNAMAPTAAADGVLDRPSVLWERVLWRRAFADCKNATVTRTLLRSFFNRQWSDADLEALSPQFFVSSLAQVTTNTNLYKAPAGVSVADFVPWDTEVAIELQGFLRQASYALPPSMNIAIVKQFLAELESREGVFGK